MKVVGLMSGTSGDGVDAVLLEVEVPPLDSSAEATGSSSEPSVRQIAAAGMPWSPFLQPLLRSAIDGRAPVAIVGALRHDLSAGFAECTRHLLEQAGVQPDAVAAIGCHGQTIWHRPPAHETPGTSLQLLDPALLAAETGIPVVSDFRSADLAAGGQGAPLVAWSDPILFGRPDRVRGLLNWGGIANITRVAPGTDLAPVAFDLGPANALIDAAVVHATGGEQSFDEDGAWAERGTVDEPLVQELLRDEYFSWPPPKSTGKERFGAALVARIADSRGLASGSWGERSQEWCDLLRTLSELTVRSTAEGIRRWTPEVEEVLVAGGGARNPTLMEGLAAALGPMPVRALAADDSPSGVDAVSREAAAFALLAWAFLQGRAGNVPESTGASGPRILGNFTPAPGRGFPAFPGVTP